MNRVTRKAFLPEQTRISQVRLRTAELERALAFYSDVLGLRVTHESGSQAVLSAGGGPGLIVLVEDRYASPRLALATGLYHFPLRYPRRQHLACAFERVVKSAHPVTGASDHRVSEAIYLNDPDGNGIELYADRPHSPWRWHNGQITMATEALELDNLLGTIADEPATTELPPQTDIGHIHLHVAGLSAAERFYSEFLGLAVTQRSYAGALFFAAGTYHHHIGVNVWAGKAAPAANSMGLVSYRLEV